MTSDGLVKEPRGKSRRCVCDTDRERDRDRHTESVTDRRIPTQQPQHQLILSIRSRREVKNALSEAQKLNLIKIVGDDGTLSRDPELVEAGVLLPLPGGRSDEAILRVDFLFDLATLDGRKKRCVRERGYVIVCVSSMCEF